MNRVQIDVAQQRLSVLDERGNILAWYPVSTALLGTGQQQGSFQTPLGRHVVAEKIGADAPLYAVFRARQLTGEIWTAAHSVAEPDRDWILTRILWLAGAEPGRNQGGDVDTLARYIYIHGTSDEHLLGQPASHGCIRMSNYDVMNLFDAIDVGSIVDVVTGESEGERSES